MAALVGLALPSERVNEHVHREQLRGDLNEGEPRYTYAGVAMMSPELVRAVRPGTKAPLAPLLRTAANEGRLSGEVFDGLWQDVGTAERLAELETQLAARK